MKLNISSENIDDLLILAKSIDKYVVGMEGNISKKLTNGLIIKSSGSKISYLTKSDFVEYNNDLKQVSNFEKVGSMEIHFHKFLLSLPDVNYVCHTHPTNTLKILCGHSGKKFSKTRFFPDQVVFNGKKSCFVKYKTPGKRLAKEITKQIKKYLLLENELPKLILLQNHGIITIGKTIDECIISTQICEKSAEIFVSQTKTKLKKLSKYEISSLYNNKKEKYRQSQL
jgi:ribulose-5-phosphate 4-epimerase/fuculose-1-phosphate aldolase